MKTPEEKLELLQKTLVEQGWELQDSVDNIGVRIADLRREIGLALIQIKEKTTIYLAVILFAIVILIKVLAFALLKPQTVILAGIGGGSSPPALGRSRCAPLSAIPAWSFVRLRKSFRLTSA